LVALNRGVDGLRRSPRLVFTLTEPEDMKLYADALPKLVAVGVQIPAAWAHEKLRIPVPKDGEPVLQVTNKPPTDTEGIDSATARLSANVPAPAGKPAQQTADELSSAAAPTWAELLGEIQAKVESAADLTALQRDLVESFADQPQEQLVKLMAAAFALAELKGMVDVQDGA
jgi:phage gp29-like protein